MRLLFRQKASGDPRSRNHDNAVGHVLLENIGLKSATRVRTDHIAWISGYRPKVLQPWLWESMFAGQAITNQFQSLMNVER